MSFIHQLKCVLIQKYTRNFLRIWIKGKFSAFQADDMGSIPIIRSKKNIELFVISLTI